MSQPGPPSENMRVAANHGSFVALRTRGNEDLAGAVREALGGLGLKPAERSQKARRTPFRQNPAPLTELAILPARRRWVVVVPGTNDEELAALLAAKLSPRRETLAITWHRATDYHRIHRFFAGRLTRHAGVYAGDLIADIGERLPGESWDASDFSSRLMEAPGQLEAWLRTRDLDPDEDRTGVATTEQDLELIRLQGRLARAEILRLYEAQTTRDP